MIIYSCTKKEFADDVLSGKIADKIETLFAGHGLVHDNESEYLSWKNSLAEMQRILDNPVFPDETEIAIEYQIPQTSKRVDFIIAGEDESGRRNIVIVELKQWSYARCTTREGVVRACTGGKEQTVAHPSFQAYSYAKTIESYNSAVEEYGIGMYPCAYLHNYKPEYREELVCDHYAELLKEAPLFIKTEEEKLRRFISKYISKASERSIMRDIDNGEIRPAAAVQDALIGIIKGNEEFCLMDEQKVVFETVQQLVVRALERKEKFTVIIEGGPGTGKSVVALQLLASMIRKGYNAHYVTKNAAKVSVFFIDEDQIVTAKDIGKISEIKKWAYIYGSTVCHNDSTVLHAQFRCNGSDSYIAFLDDLLGIRADTRPRKPEMNYDLKVVDSPSEMRDILSEKNRINNKSRMVAGYCYQWVTRNDSGSDRYDINLPGGFRAKWNFVSAQTWAIDEDTFEQIGFIHTCQGLEFDYVGVIIGKDLRFSNGRVITDRTQHPASDTSFQKSDGSPCSDELADRIIRNTYKTLLTRGQKGCYIYCEDAGLVEYIKSKIDSAIR